MEEPLKAGLTDPAAEFYEHAIEFQKGDEFSPENATPIPEPVQYPRHTSTGTTHTIGQPI